MKSQNTFLYGIIIAIAVPIVFLIAFVIFSGNNSFKLVEKDYYQKEMNYQSQIDRETRTNQLSQKVNIYNNDEGIILQFPMEFLPEDITGKIIFFRPSDKSLDFNLKINLNLDGLQSISKTNLEKGAWIVKVFWNDKKLEYYFEKRIFIN